MNNKRRLFLPIEVKTRELAAKLALALRAVDRGWTVYLGWSGAIQSLAAHSHSGVYLEKNLHPARADLFDRLRRAGHALLALEEEGLAVLNYDWYVTKNIRFDMLERIDKFLSWGDMEAEAICRRHPTLADRVVITGNPRADLMRPEYSQVILQEAAGYREKYGRYVLVVSSFSRVNLINGTLDDFAQNVSKRVSLGPEESVFLRQSLDHTDAIFQAFKTLIPGLATAFPDTPIVVRPHPAENQKTWSQYASNFNNVHVIPDGTATGWIAGATAMIHNGCTTAIEGTLLGTVPIAYRPVVSDRFDVPLPNELSEQALSFESVIELTSKRLKGHEPEISQDHQSLLKRAVACVDGRSACDRILDCAEDVHPTSTGQESRGKFYLESIENRIRQNINTGLMTAKSAVKIALGKADAFPSNYSQQKFPGLSKQDIDTLIASFPETMRPPLRITRIAPHCFRLSA